MLDLRLTKTGKLTISEGRIYCEGFDADGSCRDVAALALLWAIGQLQAELTEITAKPGGSGICAVD